MDNNPGWLQRQADRIQEDAKSWPEWKKKAVRADRRIREKRRREMDIKRRHEREAECL